MTEDRTIMWAALALTTVLTLPAQAGELSLTNKRSTHGILGPKRAENKLLPGDLLVVAFDIENLTVKPTGQILYAMGMELRKKGKPKPEFTRDAQDLEAFNNLGGTTLPAFAMTLIGVDNSPGTYVLKVTVKDRGSKPVRTVTMEEEFEILPTKFGFVQVKLTNTAGEPVPAIGVPGQTVWLHYSLVGHKLVEKAPNVNFEMQILDAAGKPTVGKPFSGPINKGPEEILPFAPTPIQLNRAGKFTIVLKATDKNAKTTTEQKFDLEVLGK
jgi:hypothetical protein